MLASTSARLLTQPGSRRSFCSCSGLLYKQTARSRPPKYVLPEDKPPRKNAARDPRPRVVSKLYPNTELFQSLKGKGITAINHRPTLVNEHSARELVRAWGVDKMHDVTVLEPYAGPGGLTRALLELPNVKKVIAIEEAVRYRPYLHSLSEQQTDDRLTVVDADPFAWESYSDTPAAKELDKVPNYPWEEVHPNLFLACQLPNTRHGEQLFVQYLSTSANRMWLWQKGRFQMGFLGSDAFWTKITQPAGTSLHHKLAVLTPLLGSIERVPLLEGLAPADQHFHRPRGDPALFSAVRVTPLASNGVDNFDALEFVATRMFISKSTAWKKAFAGVAPGAENLIPEAVRRGVPDADWIVNDLETSHWVQLANVFNDWPFKPVMFDEHQFHPQDI